MNRSEMILFLQDNAQNYTVKELIPILKEKFNVDFEARQLRTYLIHNKIKYKYEVPKRSNNCKPTKIGSEVIKTDGGVVKVKTAPHKWEYKQRKIYEDYYKVKLPEDVYVIFLDQNKRNFDIKNLKAISRRESAVMIKNEIFSTDAKITKLGHSTSRLMIKTKDLI